MQLRRETFLIDLIGDFKIVPKFHTMNASAAVFISDKRAFTFFSIEFDLHFSYSVIDYNISCFITPSEYQKS